ncbi:hypothetical protein GWN42_13460 [candidate division KSB1 bacterium]|nr:hypothetical protein [candidate division KSB1 bacterium]
MSEKDLWEPWAKLVEENVYGIEDLILSIPKKIQPLIAAALAVGNWHNSRMFGSHGSSQCALCSLYYVIKTSLNYCEYCPLTEKKNCCLENKSLYRKVSDSNQRYTLEPTSENLRKYENAYKAMRDLLLEIYREEFYKVYDENGKLKK